MPRNWDKMTEEEKQEFYKVRQERKDKKRREEAAAAGAKRLQEKERRHQYYLKSKKKKAAALASEATGTGPANTTNTNASPSKKKKISRTTGEASAPNKTTKTADTKKTNQAAKELGHELVKNLMGNSAPGLSAENGKVLLSLACNVLTIEKVGEILNGENIDEVLKDGELGRGLDSAALDLLQLAVTAVGGPIAARQAYIQLLLNWNINLHTIARGMPSSKDPPGLARGT